ncbi:dethiobiotin synthase [Reinekea marina]|uniref:ATP-dependent dethiobiotin synthetase BioD n=1 Tax=Reinekea marina TaxID=1310421 RepID=A0ABV7WRY2_9GAMM|nr:dethiobiotin synthase [Reinekea marina]MDN3650863.1 dethiobiotin synthase [Reinekea marina]
MKRKYFISGTDTDAGKTFVSVALLNAFAQQGHSTLGLKPLAAGSELLNGEEKNDDAVNLANASTVKLSYQQTNPVLLKAPMAPHIAAQRENKRLSSQQLVGFVRGTLMSANAALTLVEGAGGWRVPLNNRETLADVVKALNLDVILVVGMKLGCLNHAILTMEAIERDGLKVAGWIANCIDPEMDGLEENIQTLQQYLRAPLIGVMPFSEKLSDIPSDWLNPKFLDL